MAKLRRKSAQDASSRQTQTEWVGGRYELPFWITEDEPYRPELVFWLDVGTGIALGHRVVHPEEPEECVIDILKKVIHELSHPPTSIRVEDLHLSRRIKKEVGKGVKVRVAPTPEAEAFVDFMVSTLETADTEKSYLEDGRVGPETVGRFFRSAAELYRTAPWKIVPSDEAIFGIDAPEFQIEEGCISIIGQMGEDYGFIVFDSIWDFDMFLEHAYDSVERGMEGGGDSLLPAVPAFSVAFEHGQNISALMREEIKKHHWEIAGPTAFPQIVAFSEDRIERPLTTMDFELATVCCQALTDFLKKHKNVFRAPLTEPIREQIVFEASPDRAPVQITLPHPELLLGPLALEDDELDEPDEDEDLWGEEVTTARKPSGKKRVKKSK
jgi:hypothetical protein